MVSLPSSKRKHYLTGIDWIVRGFDHMNRGATGVGNPFQIVLELDGVPPAGELRDCLERVTGALPILSGRTRRDYNLAPYWETPAGSRARPPRLEVRRLESHEEAFGLLERAVNAPFANEREHVSFRLLCDGRSSRLAATFDHALFDAHGAEAFLRMLQREWEKPGSCSRQVVPVEPARLNEWRRKFQAGKRVNRAFLRLAQGAAPRVLPMPDAAGGRGFRFRVVSFDAGQSRKIAEQAAREAGYPMLMPYTLALTVQILHGVFVERGIDAGDYVVPVTVDTRAPGRAEDAVFFNHVSFLLFRVVAGEIENLRVLVDSLKRQMYDQVKAGLAQDIAEASLLLRIVPLPVLSRLLRVYFKGEVASFCYSFVGEAGGALSDFMGQRVLRTYHMTRVPISPGLGVFFQEVGGGLNAYVCYADGLLGDHEVDAIIAGLASRLEASWRGGR